MKVSEVDHKLCTHQTQFAGKIADLQPLPELNVCEQSY